MPRGGSRPGERRGGRQKGTANKLTADLRGMILGALSEAGGVGYLVRQAEEKPAAFMALLGRVLPTTISDPQGRGPAEWLLEWQRCAKGSRAD